jgi:phosphatidylinositol alpha-mannosyltransferase
MDKKLKIGLVSPYGWDLPGGVQIHIRDLAEHLIAKGHEVSVLTPAVEEELLPAWVQSAGRPLAIPYNGAVARVSFGPVATLRVRKWISEGDFDLLHLHEPAIPSLSLLACWAAEGPMVGTFHATAPRQKAIFAVGPILEPAIEKLSARIAVSEMARETLTEHLETNAIVIPNGINHQFFSDAKANPEWVGSSIGFVGRFDEPRKGLDVLIKALPEIIKNNPDLRIMVAGPGESEDVLTGVEQSIRNRFLFLGRVSDVDKARLLKSVDLYVAPNTGGESFGIILAEAMAAGTAVAASDIPAFRATLDNGNAGALFINEDSTDLARVANNLLLNKELNEKLGKKGKEWSKRYDWTIVADQIENVYEMVSSTGEKVSLGSELRGRMRSK